MERDFDEKAKIALKVLLENFWITRERDPELFQLIRERENIVKRYVQEKFGYRLIVHRYFAKLEKIPAEPEAWMGIESFQEPLDYALFCCLMAYLEGKEVEEKFLLSDVCEEIKAMYPGDVPLDWTNYQQRRALVRVLKTAEELGVVKRVDGEIEGFAQREDHEALYEVPVLSRYFMRSYPKDLTQYKTMEELLEEEWKTAPQDYRRHRIYRQLFLSPVVYRQQKDDPDFYYLRNFRHRLREDIEAHSDFRYELYKNAALLTLPERENVYTLFPNQKGTSDIILHFASIVREHLLDYPPDEYGKIRMTQADFQRLLTICKERYGEGWGKTYRDMTPAQLTSVLLEELKQWKMADVEKETGMIMLYPLLGRIVGHYPPDFMKKGMDDDDE
ncbi:MULTISPECIES: TIGR02678 family protein [unclassified Geobacillus]|uniref:TIGR02678 family protein n=1 Tax=unclassified Geobacillus TaxID=2642459 RepID=UPI000BE32327|nr:MULTISPECIES: TIGR02678 family protein [unclassified Geobacillus]PDM39716.1 TIGR02678 family protein [Parageobacillus yumthangensis]PUF88328.1 TIGR02678 family protein [Geobacillus sp. LYN3]RDV22484.1 TIGR02678 family protein [Parageobacillus toebii]TXK88575.1 TIGR02678 family protein [Geobacillus sp. AYS3]